MTVRSILDTKGHDILSVEPDSKVSAAVKLLSERRIGAVLVMSGGRIEGILSGRGIVRGIGGGGPAVLGGTGKPGVERKGGWLPPDGNRAGLIGKKTGRQF